MESILEETGLESGGRERYPTLGDGDFKAAHLPYRACSDRTRRGRDKLVTLLVLGFATRIFARGSCT
jgi:hypothetical protein